MDITIHASFRPHDDPDAGTSIVLEPPTLPGSLMSSALATVRSISSPEVKRLGLVRRTEVLRNG